jgi:hypothetical protein
MRVFKPKRGVNPTKIPMATPPANEVGESCNSSNFKPSDLKWLISFRSTFLGISPTNNSPYNKNE